MGDDVQTIKAGIMEIADIFVINKSDREGADRVEREIRALQSLATRQDGWTPSIVKTVASDGTGVAELANAIAAYEQFLQKENRALKKSVENWQERLIEMLRDAMLEKARTRIGNINALATDIAEHKRDPYTVVEEIVEAAVKVMWESATLQFSTAKTHSVVTNNLYSRREEVGQSHHELGFLQLPA